MTETTTKQGSEDAGESTQSQATAPKPDTKPDAIESMWADEAAWNRAVEGRYLDGDGREIETRWGSAPIVMVPAGAWALVSTRKGGTRRLAVVAYAPQETRRAGSDLAWWDPEWVPVCAATSGRLVDPTLYPHFVKFEGLRKVVDVLDAEGASDE